MTPKALSREIKWAYQRVVRGYDERIYWGFDGYFTQFLPPLKEFCKNYLTHDYCDLNPERKDVMLTTISYIEKYESVEEYDFNGKEAQEMWEYIGKHLCWYWD